MKNLKYILLFMIIFCPSLLWAGIWQNAQQGGQMNNNQYQMRTTSAYRINSYNSGWGNANQQSGTSVSRRTFSGSNISSVSVVPSLGLTSNYVSARSKAVGGIHTTASTRGFMQMSSMPTKIQTTGVTSASALAVGKSGRNIFYKPPTGDDGIYGNSLEEWAGSAVAYSDGEVKYYNYTLLKELYDAYCDAHEGQGPNGLSWSQLVAWLQANTSDKVQNYRLPVGNGLAILLVLVAGYTIKKIV